MISTLEAMFLPVKQAVNCCNSWCIWIMHAGFRNNGKGAPDGRATSSLTRYVSLVFQSDASVPKCLAHQERQDRLLSM